jgi:hypothetical protein
MENFSAAPGAPSACGDLLWGLDGKGTPAVKKKLFTVSTVAATLIATQVLAAAQEACLQHNRLQSWRAVDDRTMLMIDNQMKQYTVRLRGRCVNLTRPAAVLAYRTWQNLACLSSGEIITVTAPGMGAVMCSVDNVEAGAPGAAAAK